MCMGENLFVHSFSLPFVFVFGPNQSLAVKATTTLTPTHTHAHTESLLWYWWHLQKPFAHSSHFRGNRTAKGALRKVCASHPTTIPCESHIFIHFSPSFLCSWKVAIAVVVANPIQFPFPFTL